MTDHDGRMTVSSPAPRRSRKRVLVISVSAVIAALGSGEQADALPGAPEKNNGAQVTSYQGGGQ